MQIKTILGTVVTALVLFVFGFLYWAVNPLPYLTLNSVDDPAAVQAQAAELFPQDGLYLVPGGGNDPVALELLGQGPAVFLSIDHSPAAGADPAALALGFAHNLLTAIVLAILLKSGTSLSARLQQSIWVGVLGVLVINGSELIWWMQPLSWLLHQAAYYLLYFVIAAITLNYFLPSSANQPQQPADANP